MKHWIGPVTAFMGSLAMPALAAQPAPAASPACELHLIPSTMFGAINNTSSPFSDGVVGGLVASSLSMKRPEDVKAFIEETLTRDEQTRLLRELDLPKRLNLPDYNVVAAPGTTAGFKSFEEPKTLPRLAAGTAPCHAEIHVYSLYVLKSTLSRKFYSIFYFRRFQDQGPPVQFRWGVSSTNVDRFPPKDAADVEASRAELRAAFVANFESFVTKKLKLPKKL